MECYFVNVILALTFMFFTVTYLVRTLFINIFFIYNIKRSNVNNGCRFQKSVNKVTVGCTIFK